MRNFTATLRFGICDDFGVDQQHARPGHHLPLLSRMCRFQVAIDLTATRLPIAPVNDRAGMLGARLRNPGRYIAYLLI